jgi:ATP-dependent Clp protease ATP-binding subunit ClpA
MRTVEESQEVSEFFQRGRAESKSRGHPWFEAEHILIALLSDTTNLAVQALGEEVRLALLEELETWSYERRKPLKSVQQGPGVQELFRKARSRVVTWRETELWPEHLLLGVLHSPEVQLHFNLRKVIDENWGLEGFRQMRSRLEDSLKQRPKLTALVS